MTEFSDWLTNKYVEWRGPAMGHEKTIKEFAKYIGVSQPLLSMWMKKDGKIPTDPKNVAKLIYRFGVEIYNILGFYAPKEGTGLAISWGEKGLTPEIMYPILEEAKRQIKSISDPFLRLKAYEDYLRTKGVTSFWVDMDFPLIKNDDPNVGVILEIFEQMTPEEREEFINAGRERIEKKRLSNQPKRNPRPSQNTV